MSEQREPERPMVVYVAQQPDGCFAAAAKFGCGFVIAAFIICAAVAVLLALIFS